MSRPARAKGSFSGVLLRCVLAGAVAAAAGSTAGAQAPDVAARLQKLRQEIAELNAAEQQEIARKHRVLGELSNLERAINRLSGRLATLAGRRRRLSQREAALRVRIDAARSSAATARGELAQLLRAAFVLGREPEIKLALEGDDPSAIARLLTYYGYYARASAAHIASLAVRIAKYEGLRLELATTAGELETTQAAQAKTLASLKQTHERRELVVAKLTRDIKGKRAREAMLRRDAERLEHVVRSVSSDLADIPSAVLADKDFGSLRGQLPWPVPGNMREESDAAPGSGGRRRESAVISAPAGTPVHAVAYGRIAYSGWLPYYGLVLIVDHGGGYLTVYGHNEALYKQVGEWVQPGDVIATVGTSGGLLKPELYFQIRHYDHTLDPRRWCVRRRPETR